MHLRFVNRSRSLRCGHVPAMNPVILSSSDLPVIRSSDLLISWTSGLLICWSLDLQLGTA